MICNKCGREIDNDIKICPFCGAELDIQDSQAEQTAQTQEETPVQQFEPPVQQYEAPKQDFNAQQQAYTYTNPSSIPDGFDRKKVSKKDYINKYAPANLRKSIDTTAYILYGLSVFSLIFNFVIAGFNWGVIVEIAVLVALVVGMHVGRSKICAILLLVASIAETAVTAVLTGQIAGWWWIIAAIYAVSGFKKLDKEYNSFLMGQDKNVNPVYTPVQNAQNVPVSSEDNNNNINQ